MTFGAKYQAPLFFWLLFGSVISLWLATVNLQDLCQKIKAGPGQIDSRYSSAGEISPACQQLIVDHCEWYNNTTESWHPRPCIHGDLTHIVPTGSYNPESKFMRKLLDMNKAPMWSHQWCVTHNCFCSLGLTGGLKADYDISGLPCPDMSPAGSLKRHEGPTGPVFIAHAKLHIALGTPMLVLENVPDWVSERDRINYDYIVF